MKNSIILADNAAINLLLRYILLDTKEQYMKESNPMQAMQNPIWLNTKEKYMKELNILADNATFNLLLKTVLPNT